MGFHRVPGHSNGQESVVLKGEFHGVSVARVCRREVVCDSTTPGDKLDLLLCLVLGKGQA